MIQSRLFRTFSHIILGLLVLAGACRVVMDIPDGPAGLCNPNSVLEEGETCDGTDVGGASCTDFGYSGGALLCRENCTLDTSGCGGHCGDGVVSPGFEACEAGDLGGNTCQGIGHYDGPLACSAFCQFDTSGCAGSCGDGVLQLAYETCDGADLGGIRCRDDGKFFGAPACQGTCTPDFSSCRDTVLWGTGGLDIGTGIDVDAQGNVYVTGPTNGSLDEQPPCGGFDIFVTRYNPDGAKAWTRQLGSAGNDTGTAVRVDPSGNVYVAGAVTGSLDGLPARGGEDVVLAKYAADGTKLWTRQWGTTGNDQSGGIAVDAAGAVYVTGYVEAALDGQAHAGGEDVFLVKYDAAGELLWTRQWGTAGGDLGYGCAVDAAGDVYVAGRTSGGMDGESHAGDHDLFLVKFDGQGTRRWTRLLGTASQERGMGLATDAAGGVYVSGFSGGALDAQPHAGNEDILLVKYDGSGLKLWTRLWGTAAEDRGTGVAVDAAGNVCVTGFTEASLDGQPHLGGLDVFLSCWSSLGSKIVTRQWGSPFEDRGLALALDAAGNFYVTGFTDGTFNGQTGNGLYEIFLLYVPAL
jgi:hypothetical protein